MNDLCTNCGATLPQHTHFCLDCGAPVASRRETPGLPPPPTATAADRARAFATRYRVALTTTAGVALLLLAIGAAVMVFRGAPEPEPVAAAPPEAEVAAAPETQVASLAEMAAEYDLLQSQADQANKRISTLLATYQRRGGTLPPSFGPDFTDEQRRLLAERIVQERSGLRNLLQEMLDQDKELTRLRARSTELGAQLPSFVDAREGDRHDRIAMDFLRQQGISTERAYELVSQINLQEMLLAGFRVWTYYQNGQFGTWVTRGSAPMTPQEHQQRALALLKTERDDATKAAQAASAKAAAASAETAEFIRIAESERARAEAERERAETERAKAEADRALVQALEADRRMIRYSIGERRKLAQAGAITGNMRQVLSFERAGVLTLNPAERSDIRIDGSAYGLKRIKQITLLPPVFDPKTDIRATIDGSFAVIQLLKVEKFKQNQFIVVLE